MSRDNSPHCVGPYWLDKRADGRSSAWQITSYDAKRRTFRYASTRSEDVAEAIKTLDAKYFAEQSKAVKQDDPYVLPQLVLYWKERGQHAISPSTISSSLRAFIGFLKQDEITEAARFTQLTPNVFARYRRWRVSPHSYSVEWGGKLYEHSSKGLTTASIQRNYEDIRSACNHAVLENRTSVKVRIKNIPKRERPARNTKLTIDQVGSMLWYARQKDRALLHYIVAMLATACRPDVVKIWKLENQYVEVLHGSDLFDLHPLGAPRTNKHNAIVAIPSLWKPYLEDWANDPPVMPASFAKPWSTMRRLLDLDVKVIPKTIRHHVSTMLRNHPRGVPLLQISAQMGHTQSEITEGYAEDLPDPTRRVTKAINAHLKACFEAEERFGAIHLLSTFGSTGPKGRKSWKQVVEEV